MIRLVVVERRGVERVERGETGGGAVELGDGDGPVERDDARSGAASYSRS